MDRINLNNTTCNHQKTWSISWAKVEMTAELIGDLALMFFYSLVIVSTGLSYPKIEDKMKNLLFSIEDKKEKIASKDLVKVPSENIAKNEEDRNFDNPFASIFEEMKLQNDRNINVCDSAL